MDTEFSLVPSTPSELKISHANLTPIEKRRQDYLLKKASTKKSRKPKKKKAASKRPQLLPTPDETYTKPYSTLNQLTLLPSVDFELRKLLPNEKGLYFVFSRGALLYLGMTASSLALRWSDHHRTKQIRQFSRPQIHYQVLPNLSEDQILKLESELIKLHQPLLNQTEVPDFGHKEQSRSVAYSAGDTSANKILSGMLANYAAAFGLSSDAAAEKIVERFLLSEECRHQLELAKKYR